MPYFQISENPDLQNIIIHKQFLCYTLVDGVLSEKTEWKLYDWNSVAATIPSSLIFLCHGYINLNNRIHIDNVQPYSCSKFVANLIFESNLR